ncbi:MAG: FTR1 family iron permease [Chloroflexi bacterium]|nr:FTR1 family iron permease [Chloroflexota bacterium]
MSHQVGVRIIVVAAFFILLPTRVLAATPAEDVRSADQLVQQASAALSAGNIQAARDAYTAYISRWHDVEDGVRDASVDQYNGIEAAQRDVRGNLMANPPDPARAAAALDTLHERDAAFVTSGASAETSAPANQDNDAERLSALIEDLDSAQAALARHDGAGAVTSLQTFEHDWPTAEGLVKAKSPAAYAATESDMQTALADAADPNKQADASTVVSGMRDRLEPIAEGGASYGVLDAFVIMLREGLEALLVVGALTAFVTRSRTSHKRRALVQIWGGAAAGVFLSIGSAFALQQVFSRAGASLGSEMVEGFVGLGAAVMLFYVSYWLHSKAQLGAWQKYIQARSTAALAGGGALSLALISFLAVFREGAETAVFYLGIAPSIATRDLVLGLGAGVLALVIAGVAVLLVGMRLPLRPFFMASSLLIYYLGFKFVGTGVHALQIAGILPATPAPVPTSDFLGVYPTWETLLPQVLLVLLAAGVVWMSVRRPRPARVASA